MDLKKMNLIELDTQEVKIANGGNGVHGAGYGAAGNSGGGAKELLHQVGDFIRGFINGLG